VETEFNISGLSTTVYAECHVCIKDS
jgi:hypothetical protein